MADLVYNHALHKIFDSTIDLDGDVFFGLLVTASYTPDADAHEFRADITNEVTGTGYTTGGQQLTTLAVSRDDTGDRALWTADSPIVWTNATITARAMVIFRRVGGDLTTPGTDDLIMYKDFGGNVSSTAADFSVNLHADGIAEFKQAA